MKMKNTGKRIRKTGGIFVTLLLFVMLTTMNVKAAQYTHNDLYQDNKLEVGDIIYNDTADFAMPWTYKITINKGDGSKTEATVAPGEDYMLPGGVSHYRVEGRSGQSNQGINNVYIVIEEITTFNVTFNVEPANSGSASASPEELRGGEDVTLTAKPNDGYKFKEWKKTSGSFTINSENKFVMPSSDVTITAVFEKVKDEHDHISSDWIIDKEPTESKDGSKHKKCNVCDKVLETQIIPATGNIPETPTITADGGSAHLVNSKNEMTFTCTGKLENLIGVYVDGIQVDPSNYTLKSGSTILILKANYLDTLSVRNHTLKFQYKDDLSAEVNFSVIVEEKQEQPKSDQEQPKSDQEQPKSDQVIKDTAASSSADDKITLAVSAFLLMLSGYTVVTFRRKKNFNK